MTQFELMALEHAASFAYTEATLATKLGTEATITFTAADRANSNLILNYEAKTVRFSLTEYDDAGSEKFLMWHTSRNTTECFQTLDKFRKNIEKACIDFDLLCEPFRIKPKAAVLDSAEVGLWGAPIADSLQGNVIRGTERLFMMKDYATAHASTPAIQLNDEMKATVEAFTGTVCGAPMPPPPPKEKGE